jgi:hypothetical protein
MMVFQSINEVSILAGTCSVPPKRDRWGPCLLAGRKRHNMNETSFTRILFATASPGSPALWAGSFKLRNLNLL